MLAPIQWRQIAGYPHAAFCEKHDRLIEAIILTDGDGACVWGCPYCAEEEMPNVSAKFIEPEKPAGFFNFSRQVTYWCSERKCSYSTNNSLSLDVHKKVMHSASSEDKMKCSEGMCDKDAFDFCAQCESAMCKDHMDWKDMCPSCGADSVWPNY